MALIKHEIRMKYEKCIVSVAYFVVCFANSQNNRKMQNTKSQPNNVNIENFLYELNLSIFYNHLIILPLLTTYFFLFTSLNSKKLQVDYPFTRSVFFIICWWKL